MFKDIFILILILWTILGTYLFIMCHLDFFAHIDKWYKKVLLVLPFGPLIWIATILVFIVTYLTVLFNQVGRCVSRNDVEEWFKK
jgi:hypothetical protein